MSLKSVWFSCLFFFFIDTATPEIYTLSLHDALPIWPRGRTPPSSLSRRARGSRSTRSMRPRSRSEEHTSELQSLRHLVCRLLLEKKKKKKNTFYKQKKKKKQT